MARERNFGGGTPRFNEGIVVADSATSSTPAVVVSGSAHIVSGITGSLMLLPDGRSYLAAGDNVTITSGSAGQITIAASLSGGGSPGGSNTQVQFNDSGNFGGDSGLTFNKTTNVLSVSGGISGSITQLSDGTSYLEAGTNVTITSASNGAVTIAAPSVLTEISADTSPELGGQLVTGDHKIAYGTGNNTSEIDFTYNGGGNFTAIASVKSIDMFLDLNGGDAGQQFRIFNNLQPASSYAGGTNTDTNAIFRVREEGNVFTKGYVTASMGFSGSLTQLSDGTSFIKAGSNITITSASNGAITIASTGGGSGDITSVVAGTGLSGGATSGDATLTIDNSVVATLTGSQFSGNVGVTGSLTVGKSSASTPTVKALDVYANVSDDYAAVIDNDQSSNAHGLKVTTDGTGNGTNVFDVESSSTTLFRVRGDGRVGIGKVTSLPAAMLTISSSNADSDLAIAHKIHHIGDSDTFVEFGIDSVSVECGGVEMIKFVEDSTDTITINDGSNDVDLQVKGSSQANLIRTDAGNDSVLVGANSTVGTDNNFFVSGSIGSQGTAVRGTAVFGGDLVISGTLYGGSPLKVGSPIEFQDATAAALSGSLTKLQDGKSYLVAGSNVTITSQSNGQVLVAASDSNTTYTAGDGLDLGGTEFSVDLKSGGGLKIVSTELAIEPNDFAGTGLVDDGSDNIAINDSVVATVSGSTFAGAVKFSLGLSGSLTKLSNGTSYLAAGDNVTITSASNGQITIAASSGGGGSGDITSVVAGTGLSGGATSGDATLTIDNSVVATVSGSSFTGNVGIGTSAQKVALDVHQNPTGLSNDTGGGNVIKFGTGTTTAGAMYYLMDNGEWSKTDANSPHSGSNELLAIALGTTPATHGMLLNGYFDMHSYLSGTFTAGRPLYAVSASSAADLGAVSNLKPTITGSYTRIIGYSTNTANVIYFNPEYEADATAATGSVPATPASYVTDGLLLHLDAGDSNSYSGSGTTWYDLTDNSYDFTLSGSPTYDSATGSFDFQSGQKATNTSTITSTLGAVEAWFQLPGNSATGARSIAAGTSRWVLMGNVTSATSNESIELHANSAPTMQYQNGHNFFDTTSNWNHVVAVVDGSANKWYVNGNAVTPAFRGGNASSSGPIWDGSANAVGAFYNGSYPLVGKLAIFRIYTGSFTAANVLTNYSGSAARFGITL